MASSKSGKAKDGTATLHNDGPPAKVSDVSADESYATRSISSTTKETARQVPDAGISDPAMPNPLHDSSLEKERREPRPADPEPSVKPHILAKKASSAKISANSNIGDGREPQDNSRVDDLAPQQEQRSNSGTRSRRSNSPSSKTPAKTSYISESSHISNTEKNHLEAWLLEPSSNSLCGATKLPLQQDEIKRQLRKSRRWRSSNVVRQLCKLTIEEREAMQRDILSYLEEKATIAGIIFQKMTSSKYPVRMILLRRVLVLLEVANVPDSDGWNLIIPRTRSRRQKLEMLEPPLQARRFSSFDTRLHENPWAAQPQQHIPLPPSNPQMVWHPPQDQPYQIHYQPPHPGDTVSVEQFHEDFTVAAPFTERERRELPVARIPSQLRGRSRSRVHNNDRRISRSPRLSLYEDDDEETADAFTSARPRTYFSDEGRKQDVTEPAPTGGSHSAEEETGEQIVDDLLAKYTTLRL